MDVTIPEHLILRVAAEICPGPGVKVHGDGFSGGDHAAEAPCAWCRHDAYAVLHALAAVGELGEGYVAVVGNEDGGTLTLPASSRSVAVHAARAARTAATVRRQFTFTWLDEPTVRVVEGRELTA